MSTEEKGFVKDRNCRPDHKGPRVHEIIYAIVDGTPMTKTYQFEFDKPVEMPIDHALKFLHDPAFEVTNTTGQRLRPVKKRDPNDAVRLSEDETIAEWDELTKESLFNRCKVYPGSESLKAATSKDDLIAFIKAAQRKPVGEGVHDQPLEYDIEGDALKHILPDSPMLAASRQARQRVAA